MKQCIMFFEEKEYFRSCCADKLSQLQGLYEVNLDEISDRWGVGTQCVISCNKFIKKPALSKYIGNLSSKIERRLKIVV